MIVPHAEQLSLRGRWIRQHNDKKDETRGGKEYSEFEDLPGLKPYFIMMLSGISDYFRQQWLKV